MKQWCVYILRCGDGTLYTGMTDDFPRRLAQHRSGKGAKYTRGREPLEPVYREDCADRPEALKREYAIKRLSRAEKLALISQHQYITPESP
ncbi:MAG: GIY-YIG nuclease family protein [Oscillospiraceae bacterium]|nr:GIY-YIG nuclease family protein [Oscillospiraceae bacterium]